ncbi:hypothetical protein F443_22589, partial [Phytophthora nicotianae P1569]
YEDEFPEQGVISNDLDGAQSRQIAAEAHARPNRHVARRIVGTSRRDYGYVRSSPADTARRTALQPLDTYTCGPSARTTDEVVQRQTLRERYLTPQVTTPAEYRERLCQQLTSELDALRASFSEADIRLERRLRLDFAKRQAKQRTSGQRPSRYEAPLPPAPAVDSPTRNHESAATATGPILSPVIDLSSPHSSRGKRVAPGDSVVRPSGGLSPGDPERKRQRRQGSPAAVAPRTPMSSVNEGNLATSQATGMTLASTPRHQALHM